MTAQTRLHWRWLLLVPKRRGVGHRRNTRGGSEPGLGESQRPEERGRLARHGEERVVLLGRERERAGDYHFGFAHGLGPGVGQGLVFLEDAGGLEAVLLVLGEVGDSVEVEEVGAHAVDVLGQRDVLRQQTSTVVLKVRDSQFYPG